ncbi:plasmid pRiA4b ORF-3 family protein [Noviherbaspirillum sedimenti]|uniref:Plasmid pRiA4b ORF-3 family protein n=1 Tax=Noviherbaspirillum sedimenti TaxID=2320865 RepID=A0A3A3G0A9_9BURK|nr:plasmid pRiA4b ORF-3 family protein [Noviherbaspirillum sedimenti]RJG01351.1 plasmid pRiA4b ORF-3 family protein [Noviherbaspirillum sedimenti]
MAKLPQIITLRVELEDITPAIWRRIEVDDDITLRGLHHIIQAAFGWTSSHLHEFVIEERIYAMLDNENVLDSIEDLEQVAFDNRKAKLQRLTYPGQMFVYQYDFGDSWMHKITVEKIESCAHKMGCGNIIDGQRACPPEDVGGVAGYEEFLTAIQQAPASQQAQDYLRWIGGFFDPEAFDRRAANSTLLRMGWNGWGKK